MTWGWKDDGPRATGAAVLVFVGAMLLLQAFEPPEGDCSDPTSRFDTPENPVCIGPLTEPWQVTLVAGVGLACLLAALLLVLRARRMRVSSGPA